MITTDLQAILTRAAAGHDGALAVAYESAAADVGDLAPDRVRTEVRP